MTIVRLIAGQGADEANHGSQRFRVNNDKSVMVSPEAVAPLVAIGGFVIADPVPPVAVPHGNVRVRNDRDPAASVTWNGTTYRPDADGAIMVPIESLVDVASHGFAVAPVIPSKPPGIPAKHGTFRALLPRD